MDIQACLVKLGYKAVVWRNSYEGIVPHVLEDRPIPTMEELEAAWKDVLLDQEELAVSQEVETLIQEKLRELAIESLKKEDKLTDDGKVKKI